MSEISSATGVSLQAPLPFAWCVEQQASATVLDLRRHGNIAILRALAVIESTGPEREHDLPDGVQKSLDHLESKLDLVLLLVAELTRAGASLPPEKPVTLFSDHIVWIDNGDNAPMAGQHILLNLYPSLRLPQPLQLSATVSNVDMQPGVSHISARFDELDDELGEWLTRTIFRYHRRALQARRQP